MAPVARLFLVDGLSHVYRAYYAIRGLTNKKGLSTNAVFGFISMLRKLIQDEHPDYLVVASESEGPTVRHQQFQDYKATRPRMPEDLAQQLPYIDAYCRAMRIPVVSREGYEADDVIATLSRLAVEEGLEVVIVTIDKDLFQLVTDRVNILDTRTMTRFTPDEVMKKWSVRPDQIGDVLSLVGDTSDNIPGAPGIGEKGAIALISRFGSLEELLARTAEVEQSRYRVSLEQNQEQIRRSRELLTVKQDLPIPLELEQARLGEPDIDVLRALFEELGFNSLLAELPSKSGSPAPEVVTVKTAVQLLELARRLKGKAVGVAVEYGRGPFGEPLIQGLAVASDADVAWVVGRDPAGNREAIERLFSSPGCLVIHDLKAWVLSQPGSADSTVSTRVLDTMLMGYLLDPNSRDFSLERLVEEHLGEGIGKTTESRASSEGLASRAAAVLKLGEVLEAKIVKQGLAKLLEEMEIPLVAVLADMERTGIRIDVASLKELSREFEVEIENLRGRIYEAAGGEFNLNSPRQLAYVLFEKMGLPSGGKTGKAGHLSTGVEVLEELADAFPIVRDLLDYRELAKLKGTYIDALPALVHSGTGRIHTSFNQTVASTGRLSSSDPNLQNIPIRTEQGRKIRKAFIPDDGFAILSADYSQIELRVMAHLSEDPVLIDAFLKDEDIHQRTAREVFGEDSGLDPRELRRRAKVINFGIIYGLSAFGLAKSLKIDQKEAQRFIRDYFAKYAGVQAWIDRTSAEASRTGYVATLFGRIRQIPEINSPNRNLREFARRTAINAPIQGTAADLIKLAMVAIHRRLRSEGWRSRLLLQVHDELVFEAELSEEARLKEMVRREMEGVSTLRVPLRVGLATGSSWYDAK